MESAREGVWNLVHNCAEVNPGERVLIAGRTTDPLSAGLLNHTIEVDDRKVYADGKLLVLDDPAIQEARQYGIESLG